MAHLLSLRSCGGVLLLVLGWTVSPARSAESQTSVAPGSAPQAIVDRAVQSALDQFKDRKLQPDQLAVTLIDLADANHPLRGSYRGEEAIYPASVVKLFYLAATHAWLEAGHIQDTPELRRAMRDMIVDSSNDATSYLVDLLTGTTSGPELPEPELKQWFEQRNAVNRHFAALGYTGINVNKKPWGDGPYGRETQAARLFEPRRNLLTTDATARLLVEIQARQCVSATRSDAMMQLLFRDAAKPDEQAQFISPALPSGSRQWSKAGWTSTTRHIAAYVELPNRAKFVLVVFTVDHANDIGILPAVTKTVVENLAR